MHGVTLTGKNPPRNGYKTAPSIYDLISNNESKTYNNANNPIQIPNEFDYGYKMKDTSTLTNIGI